MSEALAGDMEAPDELSRGDTKLFWPTRVSSLRRPDRSRGSVVQRRAPALPLGDLAAIALGGPAFRLRRGRLDAEATRLRSLLLRADAFFGFLVQGTRDRRGP